MGSLPALAGRLDEAAATLTTTAMATVSPPQRTFGADMPGRFGELGRALAGQCVVAIDARLREAREAAELLAETAAAARSAADSYADVDHAARRRQVEEG
ncbi:MAG TPA: hypothetical protein VFX60_05725 [Micromonospora sp.]|nr:hypothetical protein [Micromonospora sp.]